MALAVGMIAILVVLILPLPPLLLEVRSPSRSRFPLFIPCAKRACWLS
jgi:flagellar biosynthesis component FlhA